MHSHIICELQLKLLEILCRRFLKNISQKIIFAKFCACQCRKFLSKQTLWSQQKEVCASFLACSSRISILFVVLTHRSNILSNPVIIAIIEDGLPDPAPGRAHNTQQPGRDLTKQYTPDATLE
ncbi:unnamed protein product [Amoebophrya sp. A120]|nr:unnamed protein product [Amoebophrya sp. A120]|eukprot:GSA120T00024746001.1